MDTPADSTMQVLVVDDDSETAFICKSLSTEKHQIEVSERAADGLERLNNTDSFDIVVVDFQLDEGTAIEFIAKAKQIRPDIPYLVWSVTSSEDIKKELPSFDLTVFETGIAGFRKKSEVQANAGLMASFLEEAEHRYRQQMLDHLKPVLFSAFKQLEIALNHTRSVARSIDSSAARKCYPLTRPAAFRLNRVELILRQLLGYRWNDGKRDNSGARLALDQILSQNSVNPVPEQIHLSIERFIRDTQSGSEERTAARLRQALARWSSTEETQRAVASRMAEVVEFLIYSGERRQAKDLSSEVWRHANRCWPHAPKMSCGITHAFALAAAGSPSLAEHLIASTLAEAEKVYPKQSYEELARSVFAEFEHFNAEAANA